MSAVTACADKIVDGYSHTDTVYHVCSKQELATSGLKIAYSQGWYNFEESVWSLDDTQKSLKSESKKLGLCCINGI